MSSHILSRRCRTLTVFFFFFNDTATTEIYTLSLHDALPIFHPVARPAAHWRSARRHDASGGGVRGGAGGRGAIEAGWQDRKSTRLNSSHSQNSYAVFCLKKKKNKNAHDALLYHDSLQTSHGS